MQMQAQSNPFTKKIDFDLYLDEEKAHVKEFICKNFCKGVYYKPVMHQCGFICCTDCIETHFKTDKRCPDCLLTLEKKDEVEYNRNKAKNPCSLVLTRVKMVEDIVQKHRVHCRNRDKGCTWQDYQLKLQEHDK